MDDGLFKTLCSVGVAIMVAIAGYFQNRLNRLDGRIDGANSKIEKVAEDGIKDAKDLLEHKLYVSEHYAKQVSLADLRIEQIESTKRVYEVIKDIQTDIKTLIKGD